MEFLVGEVLPVEVAVLFRVLGGVELVLEQRLGDADGLEALGHLGHVALEHAHRHRRRVLEQVVGPGEGVRVEGIGAAPHRGAARGVEDTHAGTALAGDALFVAPLQVVQLRHDVGDVFQPLTVDGRGLVGLLDTPGNGRQREVAFTVVVQHGLHVRGFADVDLADQLHLHVLLELLDQLVDVGHVLLHARLHQRLDGGHEQVHDRLLAATQAGTVAAGERQVGVLVEQDGFQRAHAFFEVVHADVFLRRVRQVQPEIPVLAQVQDRLLGLGDRAQRVVVADLDAFHAALAGVGVDGDAQETAGTGLFLLQVGEVRAAQGELEGAEFLAEVLELLGQGRFRFSVIALDGLLHGLLHQFRNGVGFLRRGEQFLELAFHLTRGARQVLGGFAVLLEALDHGVEHLADLVDQARDRRVRADRVAIAAGRAVLRDELRVVETDAGHVAEMRGYRRHQAHAHERIGGHVLAVPRGIHAAGLVPEAVDVGGFRGGFRQALDHDRDRQAGAALDLVLVEVLVGDLHDLLEAAAHHAHVVIHHALALGAELVLELFLDRVQQGFLGQTVLFEQRRGGEEGALEGDALHAQLQFGVGRLVARDLETVHVEDADVVVHDDLAVAARYGGPEFVRIARVALHDQHAALLQAGHRVGVLEHVGIGRQHHVHVGVLAVDANRLGRCRQVVGGRLALLLRPVLRVGLDVVAQQVEQRHGQVLAGGDGAPAADRVHAHGDAVPGHQVGILAAAQGQIGHVRVGVEHRLVIDFLLGRHHGLAHEIDGQVELPLLLAVRQHVLDRGDHALGLQVAAAEAERAGVQFRQVLELPVALQPRVHRAVVAAPVLQALAQRGADLAHDRQVDGQRLVGALQHRHALLALEHPAQQVAREGPEHDEVDHAHLHAALLAQPVGDRLGGRDQAALAEDQVIGVVSTVGHDPFVSAPGELVELFEGLVRQRLDVVEEVRPLRGHALHVGILVLHRAGQHGIVHRPQFRDAAALVAVDDPLRRSRGVDDVVGTAEVLGDQLALGHHQRLDQVRGQEAVLGHDTRGQRQLGDAVRHDVQVGHALCVLGHHLEEARVVNAVVVVMARVHVQRGLGHGPAADIQNIGQALADRCVQVLVHVGDALSRREVGGAQTGHRHAGGDGCRGMLAFRLDEDQRPAGDVDVPRRGRLGPEFAHLRGGRDRVGPGAVGRLALAHDDGGVAVHRRAHAGILETFCLLFHDLICPIM